MPNHLKWTDCKGSQYDAPKALSFDLFYLSLLTEGFKAQEDEPSDGLEGFFDDFGDTLEV